MNPYEFQDLVAALLKAMGYHVNYVSPPGPDRGLDIVADRMELLVQVEESDSDVTGIQESQAPARPPFIRPHVSKGKKLVAPRGFEPPPQGLGNPVVCVEVEDVEVEV